jgi:hypothetical protein
MTITGLDSPVLDALFIFFARQLAEVADSERVFALTPADIALLNPNTRTCPIFRTRRDAEITKAIYRRVPVLIDENKKDGNAWDITFLRMFDMSNDSGLFRTRAELEADSWKLAGNVFNRDGERYLPLYEAKMLHYYDHRWATYTDDGSSRELLLEEKTNPAMVALPRYWGPEGEVGARLRSRWQRPWFLAYRWITNTTNERTLVAGIAPRAGFGNSSPLVLTKTDSRAILSLTASLSSFSLDYLARQKLGGTNMTFGTMKQLPVLSPDAYDNPASWDEETELRDWISPRVLELTYTAWDLEPFARDFGLVGPPFPWDPERRFLLRCELDAAFFHLYGIARDDVDYIMETFLVFKRRDETTHGEYRTKRIIMEIYDKMASAAETGQHYQTPLDPPPTELDLRVSEPRPATVTRPRPRTRLQPKPPALDRVAEERSAYEVQPSARRDPLPEAQANGAAGPEPPNEVHSVTESSAHQFLDDPQDSLFERPAPEVLGVEEAALALHSCVPDGEKVERQTLLLNAARELGQAKLTKKVRRALNQALNAEHNAGRLRTDWKWVWKPRK